MSGPFQADSFGPSAEEKQSQKEAREARIRARQGQENPADDGQGELDLQDIFSRMSTEDIARILPPSVREALAPVSASDNNVGIAAAITEGFKRAFSAGSVNKVTLLDTKERLATFTPDDSNPHLTYEWIRSVRSIGEEKFLTRDLHYWQSKLKGSSTKLLVAFKDRDNMPSMDAFLADVETSFGYMDEHLLYSIWQKLERGKLGYEGYWELLHAHLNDWESSSAKSEADRYGMSIFPSPALIMYKFQQGIPRCDYNDLQKFGKHLLSDREQLDWLMRHGSLKRSGSVDHDASLLAVCRQARLRRELEILFATFTRVTMSILLSPHRRVLTSGVIIADELGIFVLTAENLNSRNLPVPVIMILSRKLIQTLPNLRRTQMHVLFARNTVIRPNGVGSNFRT